MSPETQALVDAITSLKQSSSILKNYLLPFIPAIITVFGGFTIATYNFKRQEEVKANAKKLSDANKFIVQVDSVFQSLIAIKSRYQNYIDDEPLNRAFILGEINSYLPNITGVENLVFLVKGYKAKEGDPYYASWNSIPRINTMVGNYLYLKERIANRNSIRERLEAHLTFNDAGQSFIDFANLTSESLFVIRKFVNESEGVIILIDSLIREISSFITGISGAIETAIDVKKIKHLEMLVKFNINNPMIQNALQSVPHTNYSKLAEILGQDEEILREAFESGYF